MTSADTICPLCNSENVHERPRLTDWTCLECGHCWEVTSEGQTSGPIISANPKTVFISYGRADALEFATQLAEDLKRHGHRVFLDLVNITPGARFDTRIEQGIRTASVLTAVISARSVEEDSVCRDEVVFALTVGRPIVPLRINPDPNITPTLLLARRNWIDFTAGYDLGLHSLVSYLDGDRSGLKSPELAMVSGAVPLDFSTEIAQFSSQFTGRDWLQEELDRWLATSQRRALILVAEAGTGKSTLAAWLARTREDVAGVYFCTQRNTRTRDPYEFVACLVGQLQAQLSGMASLIAEKHPELRRRSASDAFGELIVDTLNSLEPPSATYLVIVDSLDESIKQKGETVLDVLVQQAPLLPKWLRIVATTRPEQPILDRLRRLSIHEIKAERSENLADVRNYIHRRLKEPPLAEIVGLAVEAVASQIESRVKGIFLEAELTLDDLVDGTITVESLIATESGGSFSFEVQFRARFPNIDEYVRYYAPLLRAIAAAREPLTFSLLQRVTDLPEHTLRVQLQRFGKYLRASGQGDDETFSLIHHSLFEWLVEPQLSNEYHLNLEDGHDALCDTLLASSNGDPYKLRYFPSHLIESSRWDELENLLTDISFLESKTQAGQVFDLALDFAVAVREMPREHQGRKSLKLLEEALRRDIHFIHRHHEDYPVGLFQCLWNNAWWYDCPEIGRHIRVEQSASGEEDQSWIKDVKSLSSILESWRKFKCENESKLLWLRSMRPPAVQLGTSQIAVLPGHKGPVSSLARFANDCRIVSGSWDGTVRMWDLDTGRQLICLSGDGVSVNSVACSSDGSLIAAGADDGSVCVWDADRGELVYFYCDHQAPVRSIAFSPDGQSIASASDDQSIRLTNIMDETHAVEFCGHENIVAAIAFSPDGKTLVSGSYDGTLRIWDVERGIEKTTLKGHQGRVLCIAISPDGNQLVSGAWDNTLRLWDISTGNEICRMNGHEKRILSVCWSLDATWIISGSADKTVRVWNPTDGEQVNQFKGLTRWAMAVCAGLSDNIIVSSSGDGTIRLWDLEVFESPHELHGDESRILAIEFSPDGRRYATGAADGSVRQWNVETATDFQTLHGHEETVCAVSYSPDGRLLASGGQDQRILVWDCDSGEMIQELAGHQGWVIYLAWSADSKYLISGSQDRTARLWEWQCGNELRCLRGHTDEITAIAVDETRNHIATSSRDGTLRLWNAETGDQLWCQDDPSDWMNRVEFSPDGREILTMKTELASETGKAWIWDAKNGQRLEEVSQRQEDFDRWSFLSRTHWGTLTSPEEIAIRNLQTGILVAMIPGDFFLLAQDKQLPIWAGMPKNSTYLSVFALEGIDV